MQLVCLDLEGVLVPEIWIEFSKRTGIPELRRTTRDEPDYDKLMDDAAAENDLEKRAGIMLEAEKIFMRDLPFLPILYYASKNLVSDKLKGFEDNIQDVHASRFMSIE